MLLANGPIPIIEITHSLKMTLFVPNDILHQRNMLRKAEILVVFKSSGVFPKMHPHKYADSRFNSMSCKADTFSSCDTLSEKKIKAQAMMLGRCFHN